MNSVKLPPFVGIDKLHNDDELQVGGKDPKLYARDIVNLDLSASGQASIRGGIEQVSNLKYRYLWQSPLHGDTFALLNAQLVKVNTNDWQSHEVLGDVGDGFLYCALLNNTVCFATTFGLYTFDGQQLRLLTFNNPPQPLVVSIGNTGDLDGDVYAAVSWLRGHVESQLSPMVPVTSSTFELYRPFYDDPSITHMRIYLTQPNGTQLRAAQTIDVSQTSTTLSANSGTGDDARFRHLSAMPTGRFLNVWKGRLIVAKANVLHFSEPMTYHLSDERHGFVQLPQRITFVCGVEGGIWVGQVDHVVFLAGTKPDDFSVVRKNAKPPIPNSAIFLSSNAVSAELSQMGAGACAWLANNGFVIGTADGQMMELHAGRIKGITGRVASAIELDRRIVATVL